MKRRALHQKSPLFEDVCVHLLLQSSLQIILFDLLLQASLEGFVLPVTAECSIVAAFSVWFLRHLVFPVIDFFKFFAGSIIVSNIPTSGYWLAICCHVLNFLCFLQDHMLLYRLGIQSLVFKTICCHFYEVCGLVINL
ncbi:hypothetical protein NE237_020606 [Protea cynaroides]|uniref:Uncharacterized protein n=1 Tax=Protea cynaroides TaxID=273540 RepID=A0A9Q0H698_9MAGN|nr:hypothetical protein NE237_020606 [Protea cynaroides]